MNIALVLAGGTGTRLGADTPKQYLRVKDKMIISYCLETFFESELIDAICIVADPMWQEDVLAEMKNMQNAYKNVGTENCSNGKEVNSEEGINKFMGFSLPGVNRQLSIYNGLTDILKFAGEDSKVLIHDAARPLLSHELIVRCFVACERHEGVMPVLPMKDTVYMSEDGKVVSKLLRRESVFAGQSPEIFNLGRYYEATKALLPEKILSIKGSTEPAIMAGMDIAIVDGDEMNFKITTKADMDRFERMVTE